MLLRTQTEVSPTWRSHIVMRVPEPHTRNPFATAVGGDPAPRAPTSELLVAGRAEGEVALITPPAPEEKAERGKAVQSGAVAALQ
jgi:hypothetical protein